MRKETGAVNSNSTDKKEIQRFGAVAFVFFGSLCVIGILASKPLPTYLFAFLSVLGIGFVLMPSPLKPVYNLWLKIAHFIGRIITTLMLTFAYYLVITPSALIIRLLGKRLVPIKPDRKVSTYWVDRIEPAQPKERFLKRY